MPMHTRRHFLFRGSRILMEGVMDWWMIKKALGSVENFV